MAHNTATALEYHHQSLAPARELRDRDGESEALNDAGACLRELGRLAAARDHHHRARTMAAESGNRYELARALAGIAEVLALDGEARAARARWEDALTIYRTLGVPEAEEVAARLAAVAGPAAA